MSEPSATTFQSAVLDELGGDKVQEIAGLLGTDEAGAREVVGTTASALSGEAAAVESPAAEAPQEAPLQGVAMLGGFATGGLMAGVLAKAAKPVANAVAKKTGLPLGDRHAGRRDADPGSTRGAHEAGGEEEVGRRSNPCGAGVGRSVRHTPDLLPHPGSNGVGQGSGVCQCGVVGVSGR